MLQEENISPGEQYKGAHSFKDFEGFLYKTLQGIQDPAQERPVSPSLRYVTDNWVFLDLIEEIIPPHHT